MGAFTSNGSMRIWVLVAVVVGAAAILGAAGETRASVFWIGSTGAWTDGTKWTGGIAPNGANYGIIGETSFSTNGTVTVGASDTAIGEGAYVSNDQGFAHVLVSGGSLTLSLSLEIVRADAANSDGAVIQTGGAVSVGTDLLMAETAGLSNSKSLYSISAGSLGVGGNVDVGDDPGAGATFEVSSSNPSSINITGSYTQNSLSKMISEIDSGGITPIDVGTSATLTGTLEVNLLGGFTPAPNQVFTLLDVAGAGTLNYTGLSLDPSDTLHWQLGNSGNNLTVTYLPEPSSAALVSLAGGLVCFRRRRSS